MPALDHVFAFCRKGAPEAARLEALGLRVGRSRRHHGQGTANRCYFFGNAMLELIWVEDEAEVQSELVRPLGLWQRSRWRETGASPFGYCLRLRPGVDLPVPSFDLAMPYLPPGMVLQVPRDQDLRQPLVFAIRAPWDPPPVDHPLCDARVTRCVSTQPIPPPPGLDVYDLRIGAHHFELELDGPGSGHLLDFAPDLPLVLRW